jgi:hypothetical protein
MLYLAVIGSAGLTNIMAMAKKSNLRSETFCHGIIQLL